MGRVLTPLVLAANDLQLVGGLDANQLGRDLGECADAAPCGLVVRDDAAQLIAESKAEAIIDFATPSASLALAKLAAQARLVHIIGTTGFSPQDETALAAAARHAVIIQSGNMSLGVNLMAGLVQQAARALGDDWDIEILEMHHRHKIDAPSGTALLLGAAATQGREHRGREHNAPQAGKIRQAGQLRQSGEPRQVGEIGFAALRGGSVVGDHAVIFATENEQIRISHRAEQRDIFARGAMQAARWGRGQPAGLYTMQHVLGFATADNKETNKQGGQ